MWVDQLPIYKIKLEAVHQLLEDQFLSGHVEPSTYTWNTYFCYKEKNRKMVPITVFERGQ